MLGLVAAKGVGVVAAHVVAAGKTNNFLLPNGTFIGELIGFLIVLFVLKRYVVPRVSASMTSRQDVIRRQLEESEQARKQLRAAEAEYKAALTAAREEARRLRDEARAEGKQIIEEMRAEAQRTAVNVTAQNERQMQADRQRAMLELRAEIGRLAVELAGRIVGESLEEEARQRRVVDRFLAELDDKTPVAVGSES